MRPNPQKAADLVKFTEKTLNGKLHCLCSDDEIQHDNTTSQY